jgi:hypothetical protein
VRGFLGFEKISSYKKKGAEPFGPAPPAVERALRAPTERTQTAAMTARIIFVFIFVSFVFMMPLLKQKGCHGDEMLAIERQ